MVKSCRVKKRTIRGKKWKEFNEFKQRKDDVVNGNVNNAVNTVYTQEHDKNCLVNKTNNYDGEMVDTSISEVNSSTVSERKVETIENSEPTFDERSITGNRIIDMKLFVVVIHMLVYICYSYVLFVKTLALFYKKIMIKRKDWHHC